MSACGMKLGAVLAVLAVAGCGTESRPPEDGGGADAESGDAAPRDSGPMDAGGEPTRIVVVVDTDLSVPAELDAVEVEVTDTTGRTQISTGVLAGAPLPRTVTLVWSGGALGPVSVRVIGTIGTAGAPVVERHARVWFVPGGTMALRLGLIRSCVRVICASLETCSGSGCRGDEVAPGEFEEWTGGSTAAALDPPILDINR